MRRSKKKKGGWEGDTLSGSSHVESLNNRSHGEGALLEIRARRQARCQHTFVSYYSGGGIALITLSLCNRCKLTESRGHEILDSLPELGGFFLNQHRTAVLDGFIRNIPLLQSVRARCTITLKL